MVLVAGEAAVSLWLPDLSSACHLRCCSVFCTVFRVLCVCSPLPHLKSVRPLGGRDPACFVGSPRPLQSTGPGQPQAGEDVCRACHRCLDASERRPEEEARPSSGIVAAAGVVNQADEQRILLPGYFTTPGLHHTHPLQASLVGPGRTWTWGWGGGGQAVCERLFSLAHWISDCPSGPPGELSKNTDASPSPLLGPRPIESLVGAT